MRAAISILILLVISITLIGCLETFFHFSSNYDKRPIAVQTLSLFNQRADLKFNKASWKGDWFFRRMRLEAIDSELRKFRPDLLFFQESLAKTSSRSESDRIILSAGALADYEWYEESVEDYSDTDETEFLDIVVAPTIKAVEEKTFGKAKLLKIGNFGFVMAITINLDGYPIFIFNIDIHPKQEKAEKGFDLLKERVVAYLKQNMGCPKRIILAGHTPITEENVSFKEFVEYLQLKDVATGFCDVSGNCFTATSRNEIYLATMGDIPSSRPDRIYVHDSAYVYSSRRNFDVVSPTTGNKYLKKFNMTDLWPTQRSGWLTSFRLAHCTTDEYL